MARHPYFHSKNYGGRREGAGRKKIGITRKVSITTKEELWLRIDELIANNQYASVADYIRTKIEEDLQDG